MNENEIVRRCKVQLEAEGSISVWYFLTTISELYYDEMIVRRIRATLLESSRYIEDTEIDYKGFHRIRLNPQFEKEDETKNDTLLPEKGDRAKNRSGLSDLIIGGIVVVVMAIIISFLILNIRLTKLQERVEYLQNSLRSMQVK